MGDSLLRLKLMAFRSIVRGGIQLPLVFLNKSETVSCRREGGGESGKPDFGFPSAPARLLHRLAGCESAQSRVAI